MACQFKRQRICRTYRQPTLDGDVALQFQQNGRGQWQLGMALGARRTRLTRAQAITLRNTLTQLALERNWNG
jgi:hypothetical protein